MKVLLINGSPHKEGCTYTALKEVENTLNKHNIKTEIILRKDIILAPFEVNGRQIRLFMITVGITQAGAVRKSARPAPISEVSIA